MQPDHPAASPTATGRVCADSRCGTLLDDDAEVCDECGGSRLTQLETVRVRLCGWAGDRPVVFALDENRPSVVGRGASRRAAPDIDLRRFPNSEVVHRRHARVEQDNGEWRVTHLGTNVLMVTGSQQIVLEPGETARLRSGDTLRVGDVMLQFVVVRQLPGRI